MKRRYWTAAELRKLRRLYPNMAATELAKALRRTRSAIDNKAVKLRLRKSAAFLAGPECRFQKGMEPWNLGVTGYMGANRTSFRNGNKPQTWVPVGTERMTADGTLERKVADKGAKRDWRPVKDLHWEGWYGQIPRGRFVVHKNRDRADFRLDNLELVNRAENMRRNTIYRYPPSLVRVMKLRAKLDRTIGAELEKQNRGSTQSPVRDHRSAKGRRQAHAAGQGQGNRGRGAGHHQQRKGGSGLHAGRGRQQGDRLHTAGRRSASSPEARKA